MTASDKIQENGIGLGPASATYRLFIVAMSVYAIISWFFIFIVPVSESTRSIFLSIDRVLSFVFLYDFLRNLLTSRNRLTYLKWGWLDLLSSLPWFPVLRILRIASIIRLSRYVRGTTGKGLLKSYGEKRGESALLSTVLGIFILVLLASISILNVEVGTPGAEIVDADDALWWVWVTMTTVGYGDLVPVTNSGRLIGFILMTAGVAMVGVLTGYLANAFSPKKSAEQQQLTEIRQQLAEINRLLQAQQNIDVRKEDGNSLGE